MFLDLIFAAAIVFACLGFLIFLTNRFANAEKIPDAVDVIYRLLPALSILMLADIFGWTTRGLWGLWGLSEHIRILITKASLLGIFIWCIILAIYLVARYRAIKIRAARERSTSREVE